MLKAYMVDFDGTLADTGTANFLAYDAALREVGVSVSRELFDQQAFGRNWRQFLPGLLKGQGCTALPADVAARKVVHYRDTAHHIRFNEALVFLLTHRGLHTQAALVTSASAVNVRTALASRADLSTLFDVVVTGDDVARHKPDPQAFEQAAQLLRVVPADCVIFEDSNPGVAAGLAFGARVLKVCF